MAGSIAKLCERARYYCDEANVGYDQSQRTHLWENGETDCSYLVIGCANEAGFDTGAATYTGNMAEEFCKHGWKRLPADISTCQPGDILLNETHHTCLVIDGYGWSATIAQASIDENGNISGGQEGDQTGLETNTRPVYSYSRGWDCILRYDGSSDVDEKLKVDKRFGPKSVKAWQRQCGTPVDGVVSGQMAEYKSIMPALTSVTFDGGGSALIAAVQKKVGITPQSGMAAGGTICYLQGWLIMRGYDCSGDKAGVFGKETAGALQQSLNDGAWY